MTFLNSLKCTQHKRKNDKLYIIISNFSLSKDMRKYRDKPLSKKRHLLTFIINRELLETNKKKIMQNKT